MSEIAAAEDRFYLQEMAADGIVFSRRLSIVDSAVIHARHRAHGGPVPPSLQHDGIDDAYLDKASIVHYYHQGKWLRLQGAD